MAEEQFGSHEGVLRYFYFIKEEVSSDWRDLAFHLKFRPADIYNIAGRNRDDKSCCMDLLEEWLKRNGDRATIEYLMEALSKANLQSTVDGLKKKFPGLGDEPTGMPQDKTTDHQDRLNEPTSDCFKIEKDSVETPQPEGPHRQEPHPLTDVLQKSMKQYYELKLTKVKPLIWNDNFSLNLRDIFTELELIRPHVEQVTGRMPGQYPRSEKETEKLSSLDDLFRSKVTKRFKSPRCILIEGEAGGGKTMFLSKQALDAVSRKTKLGRRHDIVLLIRLREVREGETIEEIVWDQCVPETTEGVDVQSIRAILQRNESSVLFLLDGYDELQPKARTDRQAIPKLLSGKIYPNSTVVVTSRPSAGVQQHTQPDCHIHIKGFSPKHARKYVLLYFRVVGNIELAEEFIKRFFEVRTLAPDYHNYFKYYDSDDDYDTGSDDDEDTSCDEEESVCGHNDDDDRTVVSLREKILSNIFIQTPIFLMLICLLWEEDREMVSAGTRTGLYNNLLTCLVKKHCKREGVDMPTDSLPANMADLLLQLGKHALGALLRNETLLDITKLPPDFDWQLLVKAGVVSLEVSASKLHPRKQLTFLHKTMQEFLAGRYAANAVLNGNIVELLQLTSITKVLEHSNLLQFTCGCDSQAAKTVLEGLTYIRSKEFESLQAEQFERSYVPVNRKEAHSLATYKRFAKLCLRILSERQETELLQAFSQALPIVILEDSTSSTESAALKFYIQNLQSVNLPDRLIVWTDNGTETIQYLHQCFTASFPGLILDLGVGVEGESVAAQLVSVLKNVPGLRALDLSSSRSLSNSTLQTLVRGFNHLSLLEELDLSEKYIGDDGIKVLQVGLPSVPHLAVLLLPQVGMTAVGMSSLAPYMRHLARLRVFDIGNNYKVYNSGLKSLITILPTFTAMQVLVLQNIEFCTAFPDMHSLAHALAHALSQLTRLIKLNISENYIGDTGLEILAATLSHLTAIKVLDLSRTGIGDSGISALVKALSCLVELQELSIHSNWIGDSGIMSLVQILCQPIGQMERNPPDDKSLTTALDFNTTLQKLHIGWNRVTGAGLGKVTQLISKLPALTWLDMSGSPISSAELTNVAAVTLARALPKLPDLEWLLLREISMEAAGFQAVVQAAAEHPKVEYLFYSRKEVPEGADTSARCLMLWG